MEECKGQEHGDDSHENCHITLQSNALVAFIPLAIMALS
jgi:hypothetical protein